MKPPTITYEGYLTIGVPNLRKYPNAPGMWKTTGALTKGKPGLGKDEVAVKIAVELPVSLFTVPQIEARITVADGVAPPMAIDLAVKDNIEQLIQQQTGFDVRLVVPE